jgi:Flp pilus assembly pilin Flp
MKPSLTMRNCRGEQAPTLRWNRLRDESGQDLIEYALLTSLMSVALIGVMRALGNRIIPLLDRIMAALP